METKLNILVLNHLADRHISMLTNVLSNINIKSCEPAEAEQFIAETDILVCWGSMDINPLVAQAANLKWVHALSAGVENLIPPLLQNETILLTNSKGIHSIPVSEHVLGMMLSFSRGLNTFGRQQQSKQWKRVTPDEIHEKTIGIVGLGSIGREIAKKAKSMGMTVLAAKREMTSELFVDELYSSDNIKDMLPLCDYVVTALPLIDETDHLFKLDYFRAMKPSAYFINIARGAIVDENDLITALQQGIIRGAGIDVFEQEPLPETSPLWDMPNVIITPHVAALSPMYMDRAIKLFADNLSRFIQNGEMLNIVDKTKGY